MKQLKEYVFTFFFFFMVTYIKHFLVVWSGFLLNICIVLLKEMKVKIT